MIVNVYVLIQESTDDCSYYSRDFIDVFGSREQARNYIQKRDYCVQHEFRIIKKTITSE